MNREKKSGDREKRSMERFSLDLSAIVSVKDGDQILKLKTVNISAGGALLKTDRKFPKGTPVKMALILPVVNLKRLKGGRTRLEIAGEVVRNEKDGMAVRFETKYRMQPMENKIPPHQIHVVGPNRLQNELLARFLKTEAELNCMCDPDACSGAFPEAGIESLVLLDCLGLKKDDAWASLPAGNPHPPNAALFNVVPDPKFEKESENRDIRGIFYIDDNPETLREGIESILKGDSWFLNKPFADFIANGNSEETAGPEIKKLTPRETEILQMVSSGKRNKDIAEELGISKFTVKTHVYKIYKKIGVKSRLQATLWVASHPQT